MTLLIVHTPTFWYTISFLIFCGLAYKPAKQKIKASTQSYQEKIKQSLQKAQEIYDQALRRLQAVERRSFQEECKKIAEKNHHHITERIRFLNQEMARSHHYTFSVMESQRASMERQIRKEILEEIGRQLTQKVSAAACQRNSKQ